MAACHLTIIANCSYAVSSKARGRHIGEKLVIDSLAKAKELGFRNVQFNAVVESNIHACHLYERAGFIPLGVIPEGFRMKDGHYENICRYYYINALRNCLGRSVHLFRSMKGYIFQCFNNS